jgi:hypothetical protein
VPVRVVVVTNSELEYIDHLGSSEGAVVLDFDVSRGADDGQPGLETTFGRCGGKQGVWSVRIGALSDALHRGAKQRTKFLAQKPFERVALDHHGLSRQ